MPWFLATVLLVAAGQFSTSDPWASMRFFVGRWEGTSTGEPGNGTVSRTYEFVLGNKFLQVRDKATYPPQERNPKGEVHEEWGMFSYDTARKKFVLRQFHGEGFVNQYVVQTQSSQEIIFASEAIENTPRGYRARETYRILNSDEFVERFEVAEPGRDFGIYSETKFRRSKSK
jgi:hypothetical protein